MDYQFEMFCADASDAQPSVDCTAIWPTPVPHLNPPSGYEIPAATPGALAAEYMYTVVLPQAALSSSVHVNEGGTVQVALYQIDVAAQCSTGNSAIRLVYRKN